MNIFISHPNAYYLEGLSAALLKKDKTLHIQCSTCSIGKNAGDFDLVITTEDSLMSFCRNERDVFSDRAKILLLKDDMQKYIPENLFDAAIKMDAQVEAFMEKIDILKSSDTKKIMRLKRRRDKLSSREYQVAMALLSLKKNKEIGQLLGLSEKTISTYKRRIFQKLQIKSVLQLSSVLKMLSVI
ncbi:MAG: LuxR C-terminal-related transcriptional regulator [Flavobacteriales bacterium]|nr:LuxR C-terminal-related transcriptional regulator [Flavobacteriales bacterium]